MRGLRIAIIGGGIGGLSAALELSGKGAEVHLFEASEQLGGKLEGIVHDGVEFDAGPTVLTMRWVFEELFARAGLELTAYLTLHRLERLARHFWSDGTRFDLLADEAAAREEVEAVFGAKAGRELEAFRAHARRLYTRLEEPFIRSRVPSVLAAGRRGGLRALLSLAHSDWSRSLWRAVSQFFSEPKLRQLFARYATYYGSSPYQAPATLSLIADVELQGVWTPRGGMRALARAIACAARERGVLVRVATPVRRLEEGRQRTFRLVHDQGGGEFDAVVFNGAPEAIAAGRLGGWLSGAVAPPSAGRSSSAHVLLARGRLAGPPLAFHNVFFSDAYRAEFDAVFGAEPRSPDDPTVYVCAQARVPGATASPGPEPLFLLINAPALREPALAQARAPHTREERTRCLNKIQRRLERCGSTLRIGPAAHLDPPRFALRYPSSSGALYGGATHDPLAPFRRPTARTRHPRLYLCGGATHPGAGVPMASMSGSFAAQAVIEDLPSMSRSRVAATRGGTSTSSRTTASPR